MILEWYKIYLGFNLHILLCSAHTVYLDHGYILSFNSSPNILNFSFRVFCRLRWPGKRLRLRSILGRLFLVSIFNFIIIYVSKFRLKRTENEDCG
jgi:hypothetical protein